MTELLTRLFIRDRENVQDPAVRQQYGTLSGMVGICLNVLLFIGKLIAGAVSASIAITADAFNNLSDAGSSSASAWRGKSRTATTPLATGALNTFPGWPFRSSSC